MADIECVILAGGHHPWAEKYGVANKALLKIGNKTLIERVASAPLNLGLKTTILTSSRNVTVPGAKSIILPKEATFQDTLTAALDSTSSDRILVIMGDHPFLEPSDIEPYLNADAELVLGLVPIEAFKMRFPGMKKTFVRLREGKVKLAGAALVQRRVAKKLIDIVASLYRDRKKPWKLIGILGPIYPIKLILGLLTIPDLKRVVKNKFGISGEAVMVGPGLAFDIDSEKDYLTAIRIVEGGD